MTTPTLEQAVRAALKAAAHLMDEKALDYDADAKRFRPGSDPHHWRAGKASDAAVYANYIRALDPAQIIAGIKGEGE